MFKIYVDGWLVDGWREKKNWDAKSEKNHYTLLYSNMYTAPPIAITLGISSHTHEHSIFMICANLSIDLPPLAISYFHSLHIWQSEKRYVSNVYAYFGFWSSCKYTHSLTKWHHIPKCTVNNETCLLFFFLQISLLHFFCLAKTCPEIETND